MTCVHDEKDLLAQSDAIVTRHAISLNPVRYMLQELRFRPAVAELFASLADEGYSEARIIAAAQALTGEPFE